MHKFLIAASLFLAGTANAQTVVAALESNPGEAKSEFVVRVAHAAAEYTRGSGFESCGSLAQSAAGRWSVRLVTTREPLACEWTPEDTLPGYTATEDSIHSHPRVESLIPATATSRERHALKLSFGPSGCTFSPHDLVTGAGYLVACGKLLYHDGTGNVFTLNNLSRR